MKNRASLGPKRHSDGFTLIELMIVVAIVGILAAIAYPSYLEHVRRTARADAQAQLLSAAQFMERFYTNNNRYDEDTDGNDVALPAGLQASPPAGEGTTRYNINLAENQNSYTLTAVPTGPQSGDRCGSLTYNNIGTKGLSGQDAGLTVADCWR